MSEIKRIGWHGVHGMQRDVSGDYVLHSDHEAEVARLRAELQNAAKAALDAVALSCEKEREADALRAEVEMLRFAASEVGDFLVCLPGMSENDVEIVASRLVERIDAAMGASA